MFCFLNQWDQYTYFSQFLKEVEAKFLVKGSGYLILPEQTCNVQGRVETMDFCSHLNPCVLSVVSQMAYRPHEAGRFCFSSASARVLLMSVMDRVILQSPIISP